jgi:lipopolysaccharide transport system permease protein
MLGESCVSFISAEGLLKQARLPYAIFVFSSITRNVIVFFHHLLVYVVIALIYKVEFNLQTLMAIPALLLLCINAGWVGILIATVCARFRDMGQIVSSLIQVAFFVTPIFWSASQVSGWRSMIVTLNPLFHCIDILRQPLLGRSPAMTSWFVVLGMAVVGWWLTLCLYNRVKTRIVYWI